MKYLTALIIMFFVAIGAACIYIGYLIGLVVYGIVYLIAMFIRKIICNVNINY